MAAKSRAKWEHYCAEKDEGLLVESADSWQRQTRARNAAAVWMTLPAAGTKGKAGRSS